jgi:hypothetical protein
VIEKLHYERDVERFKRGELDDPEPNQRLIAAPPGSPQDQRFLDIIGPEHGSTLRIGHEEKIGLVRITSRAGNQIAVDEKILEEMVTDPDYSDLIEVDAIHWDFFADETLRGVGGPDGPLVERMIELQDKGYRFTFDIYLGRPV